ncbi:hypothetical protein ACFX2A_041462 [Malus domestica]
MTGAMMQQPVHDPFYASNRMAAPHSVQMAAMANQQQAFMLQQQQQQMMMMGQQHQMYSNPFGTPHGAPTHRHYRHRHLLLQAAHILEPLYEPLQRSDSSHAHQQFEVPVPWR